MVHIRKPRPRQQAKLQKVLDHAKALVGKGEETYKALSIRRRVLVWILVPVLLFYIRLLFIITVRNLFGGVDAQTRALRKRNRAKAAAKWQAEIDKYRILELKKSQINKMIVPVNNNDPWTTEEEEYECLGWRHDASSSHACSLTNERRFWLQSWFEPSQVSCDEYVPVSAGYCELQSKKTGNIVQLMHKPCNRILLDGELPHPVYLTCRQAVAFNNYKYNAHNFQPEPPLPFPSSSAIGSGNNNNNNLSSRGIVIQAFDEVLSSVYAILKLLRENYNCQLPIELWSMEGELDMKNPILQHILVTYGGGDKDDGASKITLRVIHDENVKSYMSKPYSIAYSYFEEVLFLDSDNFPLRDPTELFEEPGYQSTGAMFWKDFWAVSRDEFYMRRGSLLWELLGIPPDASIVTDMELESGQIVIHRRKSQKALHILLFFARTFQEWFEPLALVLGDKDLFRLAWYLSDTPYFYQDQQPPGMLGLAETKWYYRWRYQYQVCGLTMVQYDLKGQPLFLHRNAVKLTEQDVGLKPIWEVGAHFVGNKDGINTDKDGTSEADMYKVGFTFASHHLLGRMCYYPHRKYAKYFEIKDYRVGKDRIGKGAIAKIGNPIHTLEQRILAYAGEALALGSAVAGA